MSPILHLLAACAVLSAGQGAPVEETPVDEAPAIITEATAIITEAPAIITEASAIITEAIAILTEAATEPPGSGRSIIDLSAVKHLLGDLGKVVNDIINFDLSLSSGLNRMMTPVLQAISKLRKDPEQAMVGGMALLEKIVADNQVNN